MFSRRLFAALLFAPALAMFACSTTSVTAALKQAASDANIIATAISNALPQLATVQGIPPDSLTKAASFVVDIQRAAAAISAASTAADAQPSVQQLEAGFNALVGVLATLPLPPQVATVIQAANVLLPVIEIAVGMAVTPKAGAMSPDQARAVLAVSVRR